ncbi:MAG: agmatine deiminase [Lawsonibacter sp.]|nr:agmatine deiminase [Lawsonibacter sp.]
MTVLPSIPTHDGFYLPAESDWHTGSWMIWPQRQDNWRLGGKPAQEAVCKIAQAISQFEDVTVCVNASQYQNARNRLSPCVRVIEMSSNEAFVRDTGPTFVVNGSEVRGIDWTFNGYGGLLEGLYFPWDADNRIARKICETAFLDSYQLREFVLEGCAFRCDGEGTLIVTEECLLSEGRNPNLSKDQMEITLKEYLGISKVIWLHRGLYLDEGKGHIDNLLCFVRPGEILLSWTDDPEHPQYKIVREALEVLSRSKDACGRSLKIHRILLPKPLIITSEEATGIDSSKDTLPRLPGDMLVGSYLNFYMPNCGLIYPMFDDENDVEAERLFATLFPQRRLVGIRAREIFLGGGGIHSIVLQQPSPQ